MAQAESKTQWLDVPAGRLRVIRSDRRTLALEVTAQGVALLRAPRRCPASRLRQFAEEHGDWLQRTLARQQLRAQRHPEPHEAEREALIAQAEAVLPGRVTYYAARMGLTPTGLRITGAKKRFGSCSGSNRICFSWRLMQYPPEAVDYVVVHELAHIAEKNHGPAFYARIAAVLPDYRARQALLRE